MTPQVEDGRLHRMKILSPPFCRWCRHMMEVKWSFTICFYCDGAPRK